MGRSKTAMTIAILLSMIPFSFAHADEEKKDDPYGGLYVGTYLGYTQARGLITTTGRKTGGSGTLNNSGLTYSLAMGYGQLLENGIYLGAEFEVGSFAVDGKGTVNGQPAFLDVNESYGLFARLGYRMGDDSLLYVKSGYTRTGYDLAYANGSQQRSLSGTASGFSYGFGCETPLDDRISFKSELANIERTGTARHDLQVRFGLAVKFQ